MDLRNILLDLAASGVSILFSSHQLGEIERIADRIISIKNGEIIPFDTNLTNHGNYVLTLDGDLSMVLEKLEIIEGLMSFDLVDNKLNFVAVNTTALNDVLKELISQDINVAEIVNEFISIEDLYLEIFGD